MNIGVHETGHHDEFRYATILVMSTRTLTATEFKAKCLAILDEVDSNGTVVTITKRGRPVATLQGVKKSAWRSPAGVLEGKIDPDVLAILTDPYATIQWGPLEEILDPPKRGKRA